MQLGMVKLVGYVVGQCEFVGKSFGVCDALLQPFYMDELRGAMLVSDALEDVK